MPSPLTYQNFADIVDPRYREIASGAYEQGKDRIGDFFTVRDDDRDEVKMSALTPMGEFQTFTGVIGSDGPDQEYDVTATHIEMALKIEIQRRLYDDAQFDLLDDMYGQLGHSAFKTQQNDGADMFNNSFSNPATPYVHTEAVALCSNSHTTTRANVSTATGFDNLVTSEFSPTALSSAWVAFRQFRDASGDRVDNQPNGLVIPVDLAPRAEEVIKTMHGLDDANMNKNVHYDAYKVFSWHRLTSAVDWWVVNIEQMKKNLFWFWRIKLELSKMESFDNATAKARGYYRYSYLRRDWRWVHGANVG